MSRHTASDVQEADRLWDEMPLPDVAEKTGILYGTLDYWREIGLISTDTNHQRESVHKYNDETIERADALWDRMPLSEVSELIEVPYGTLMGWSQRGWIETDEDHIGAYQQEGMREKTRRAAYLAHETDLTNRAAAEKMRVAESTFYRYLRLYRKGAYE